MAKCRRNGPAQTRWMHLPKTWLNLRGQHALQWKSRCVLRLLHFQPTSHNWLMDFRKTAFWKICGTQNLIMASLRINPLLHYFLGVSLIYSWRIICLKFSTNQLRQQTRHKMKQLNASLFRTNQQNVEYYCLRNRKYQMNPQARVSRFLNHKIRRLRQAMVHPPMACLASNAKKRIYLSKFKTRDKSLPWLSNPVQGRPNYYQALIGNGGQ